MQNQYHSSVFSGLEPEGKVRFPDRGRVVSGFLLLVAVLAMLVFQGTTGYGAPASAPKLALPGGIGQKSIVLVPHRAVYEMTLARANRNSGISNIDGRMVFDFSGSPCEGYTLNMRMATNVTDKQGDAMLSDLRSSTWEQGQGRRFRFTSSQYYNNALAEVTRGDAVHSRRYKKMLVHLKKPARTTLRLPQDALFPSQHTRFLIHSARMGQRFVSAKLYDGSEKGKKVFFTTALIGKPSTLAQKTLAQKTSGLPAKVQGKLKNIRSWPVALSYFEKSSLSDVEQGGREVLPSYELFFRLHENGVSRDLLIDYGDFALEGKLSHLEFYPARKCEK